jgi:hypothetical protein
MRVWRRRRSSSERTHRFIVTPSVGNRPRSLGIGARPDTDGVNDGSPTPGWCSAGQEHGREIVGSVDRHQGVGIANLGRQGRYCGPVLKPAAHLWDRPSSDDDVEVDATLLLQFCMSRTSG